MSGYLDEAVSRLKEFEGSVPWMYLDTVGRVTVGVGSMLPDARMAGLLPFQVNERAATAEEISAEFARVSGMAKGRPAEFYRKRGGPRLGEDTIDTKLCEALEGSEGYLRAHLRGYDDVPVSGKLALLDMIYNLGPGRLFHEFPKFLDAIERRDWSEAAKFSVRRGPSAARNRWTRSQLLAAAGEIAVQAEAAIERLTWGWIPVLACAGAALWAVFAISPDVRERGSRRWESGKQPELASAGRRIARTW